MEHPFVDLSDKTSEELNEISTSLTKKLNFAYSTGNQALINQLHMVIEHCRRLNQEKLDALLDKHKLQTQVKVEKNDNSN